MDASGRDIPLRRSEYELLRAFIAAPGRALSRDHLLEAVAGRRSEPFDRSIDVLVGRLRRKIEPEPAEPRLIVTVPGVGYRLAAKPRPVPVASDAAPAPPKAASPPQASPERRQLTVMQCGLCGPGLSAARRDPEDLQRLLVAFHGRCAAIIEGAGGAVAKRLGDAVLAYFGYPETHEDEAERAIWAALRLVDAARAIETGLPDTLRARVGIATGLVLVGDLLGAGEPTVLGEAPDRAAGLLVNAEPGTVLIGATTRRLVGDTFRYRDHAPIALDGRADPISVWEVVGEGVESRFEALHGHAVTELVGREEELFLLLRRWEQAKAGAGRAVLVMGEPGIGQSRLVRAVLDRLENEVLWRLRYFCSPHYRDSALHPVITRIEDAADFTRDDTAETKFAKLKTLLARSDASDEAVALVASLLSLPVSEPYRLPETSPQRLREWTVAALLELFAGLAARRPTLMITEDLHWSDPTTLELGTRIIERAASMRVLVLMTARPEFKPPWPDQAHVTTLLLNRLSDDEAAALVQHVAGEAPMPRPALQQIVDHAEGVPLFAEELTKAVLESGLSADGERSAPLPVPNSLHDLLLARLDRLGAAREVAQIGAVIGREFTHELLGAVAGQPDPVLEPALAQLVRSELVFRAGTPPDARYGFKHVLVQQAAYESLPRSRRSVLHATIAETLLKRNPPLADSQLGLLAWHCEQGGLVEKAAYFYTSAGLGSTRHGAYAEAHEQFANASRMVAAMPEGEARDRSELHTVLCSILATSFRRGDACSEIAEAHYRATELWERLGQPVDLLGAAVGRYLFHHFRGEMRLAQELASSLLHTSQKQADPR
ncbi:MAG: winged helix-turn-helix domain-containing protein, partial [Xanthobacteraceae bacterium]|nr:winged helix-turn-helix domain-containing protein [Xanthobacteraceae bacterium]